MRYRIYSLESNLLASRSRHQLQNAYLYLVTSPRENLLTVVESALQGGLTLVQYRNKKAEDMVLLKEAKQLCQLCHQYGALFIINDRVDLAVAVNADGVHLGQQDMPLALAREILGTDKLIGRSATNKEEMTKAIAEGADYLGVGPVYETPTKPGKTAAGFDYFRYVAANCPIPWFAIGGINSENLDEVLATGAKRVAVVRAIMQAEQPKAVVEKLLTQLAKPQSTPCSTTQVS
jgi:thiamine-phosphate pyrophosphorylase